MIRTLRRYAPNPAALLGAALPVLAVALAAPLGFPRDPPSLAGRPCSGPSPTRAAGSPRMRAGARDGAPREGRRGGSGWRSRTLAARPTPAAGRASSSPGGGDDPRRAARGRDAGSASPLLIAHDLRVAARVRDRLAARWSSRA